ncbi:transcriptional regulator GcvA [Bradyrhizobium sp. 61]|uniref:transcriptional regulator GcvA n=1 Tax=unclassified Bradyrhizobium TaxID=2631580 RepID=UPI001FF881CB|nr:MULTISPECIES: transcriptional regulator GcvA [unclassified Bradyrhizobium]MCK1274660.1 transcriptional regulator GcvA [Bradyrhizobium sp. 61]MCK1441654.1 transcriptional regulator GcvA [Bradyrhizobium sp. 48]MCK1465196.1 transcriptional regulator GcvA [Bradyrhizobium sp. 2]
MANFVPRRSLPPLNSVRAFEAAARLGSLKEAAAELSVTHGAVSQQIRLLEDWLGAPALFRRSVRRVVLTPAGAALLAEFGPALDRISAAVQQHRTRRHDTPSIALHVNALATFSLRWLLPRMGAFRKEHPDIEVRLSTSNETIDELAESFDVVIRGGPDTFPGHTSRFLFGERRLPVCSPTILDQAPLTGVRDLSRHTLLHTTSMPRLWRDWLAEAGEPALRPEASLSFDHFYLTIQAAIDGLGVAMGPTALVANDLAAGRLTTPFPDISLPARSYFAYLPEARRTDPHIAVFCDWLEQQGRDLISN